MCAESGSRGPLLLQDGKDGYFRDAQLLSYHASTPPLTGYLEHDTLLIPHVEIFHCHLNQADNTNLIGTCMSSAISRVMESIVGYHPTFIQVASVVLAFGIGYGVKIFLGPSPLAMVAGPPSPSYLVGHWKAMTTDDNATQFCIDLSEKWGGIVKIRTFFNVSFLNMTVSGYIEISTNCRDRCFTFLIHLRSLMYRKRVVHGLNHRMLK